MANWKQTLKIGDLWRLAQDKQIKPCEFSRLIAVRLRPLNAVLADRFRSIDEDADFEEVDALLDELYDWGDKGHRCWIDRHTEPEGQP